MFISSIFEEQLTSGRGALKDNSQVNNEEDYKDDEDK